MRVLCLILASDADPAYLQFQQQWRRYMRTNPAVDCYFYKGDQTKTFLEDDTLWVDVPESFSTVYEKTLKAFSFFAPQLDAYTYVFRTNLSTVVAFPSLVEFCKTLPTRNVCASIRGNYESITFPSGCGFLLSSDLVRRIVDTPHPLIEQDDVSIGAALQSWKIPIRELVRVDFLNGSVPTVHNRHLLSIVHRNSIFPNHLLFIYRFKSSDRQQDIEKMSYLIDTIYRARR